jgi:hypothetical protein
MYTTRERFSSGMQQRRTRCEPAAAVLLASLRPMSVLQASESKLQTIGWQAPSGTWPRRRCVTCGGRGCGDRHQVLRLHPAAGVHRQRSAHLVALSMAASYMVMQAPWWETPCVRVEAVQFAATAGTLLASFVVGMLSVLPRTRLWRPIAGAAAGGHGGQGAAAAAARPGLPQHQHAVPGGAGEAVQGAA